MWIGIMNDLIACACHSSQYNPDGTVKQGPADDPLTKLELKEEEV
jgi:Rieske Fe-S protein